MCESGVLSVALVITLYLNRASSQVVLADFSEPGSYEFHVPDGIEKIKVSACGPAGNIWRPPPDTSFCCPPPPPPVQSYGGYISATLTVNASSTLYVNVAGQSSGRGTDIRTRKDDLHSRLLIAGGGGNGGYLLGYGGNGGGRTGGAGGDAKGIDCSGKGGTQSAGGAAGQSCPICSVPPLPNVFCVSPGVLGYGYAGGSGGAGGGYYGGGAGCLITDLQTGQYMCAGGGGGGSSFVIPNDTLHEDVQGAISCHLDGSLSISAPTNQPSFSPTAPSSKPSAVPTYSRTQILTKSVFTSSISGTSYAIPDATFKSLNNGMGLNWYLTAEVYGTGWGTNDPRMTLNVIGANGASIFLVKYCNAGNSCDNSYDYISGSRPTRCVMNFLVTPDNMNAGDGGSITLRASTNFYSTVCKYNGSDIFIAYSLWASQMMPTYRPTEQPTSLALGAAGRLGARSVDSIISSTGAPFYIVAAVAGLLAAMGIFLAQSKSNKRFRDNVHESSIFSSILSLSLIGSSFASEMFLAKAMFDASSTAALGVIVLVARLFHLPAALYLLSKMFVASADSAAGSPPAFGSLLEQDMILQGSKVWGSVAIICMVDVTVLRYFPWLVSEFATKADGYPNAIVFLVCVGTKLAQSVLTVACQVSYFVIVNAGADTRSMAAAFLVLNMCTTILLCLLNGAEFIMRRGILLSGMLKTAASNQAAVMPGGGSSGGALPRQTFSIALPSMRVSRTSLPGCQSAGNTNILEERGSNISEADLEIHPPSLSVSVKSPDVIPSAISVPATTIYGSRGNTPTSAFNPLTARLSPGTNARVNATNI